MKYDKTILLRIDTVINSNKKIEWLFIGLTTLLFLAGIACIISAICIGQYLWASPSVVTTGLLYYPLNQIRLMRDKNIALAVVPMLIDKLPETEAAKEIQKLIENLYGGKK